MKNGAQRWSLERVASQSGKTILVTGSNTGIGFATAQQLAEKGAEVILACRSREKGEAALARLQAAVPGAVVTLMLLDLANLASVRECAAQVNARYQRLDVLINNAGLMMPPLARTADGFELQFGTNVVGHFAFTGLLLPLLSRTPKSRVVWLSSLAHQQGQIDFDNLNAERSYGKSRAYAQSKLADLMLAYEMQRRMERKGESIIALGAHPGVTKSDLSRHLTVLKWISVVAAPLVQDTDRGAWPSVLAATDPDAHGGDYYGPMGFAKAGGAPGKQPSSARSHDAAVAARLWQTCEQLSGVRYLD